MADHDYVSQSVPWLFWWTNGIIEPGEGAAGPTVSCELMNAGDSLISDLHMKIRISYKSGTSCTKAIYPKLTIWTFYEYFN